ncbi:MAG: nodulation protein NfeD [Chromatiaceae bacterium]|jgi:membrane-bound serine protease (ClpP class)|nr:nodulation protein NfeD [Chromatiaceae bacterium]
MTRHQLLIGLLLLLSGLIPAATGSPAAHPEPAPQVLVMEIDGAIGPITAQYFTEGLRRARASSAPLLVLRLDTPGGLDAAMRDIVKDILASPLPVVCFVSPSGARAASAGTYILYACHVAAMAPATNLGSATPVQIGGFPGLPDQDGQSEPADDSGTTAQDATDAGGEAGKEPADKPARKTATAGSKMERKIINDAAAFIRGLAKLRGRNAEWAERAVRQADNLTADEALERGVIDLVAQDVPDLLRRIDGREVRVLGESVTLHTAGLASEAFDPDWRTRILSAITDPNIAYVLMLVGIYGLIYELANPGAILPGVIGAIALLTALFAFQALPVNYAGLALLVLGVTFMVLEAFVPSFGALGIGGAIAFVIGSVILYRDESGQIGVAVPLIATFAILGMALFVGVLGYALKTRKRPVVSGREQMLHAIGVAEEDFAHSGRVRIHSETWNARASEPVHKGQRVKVTALEGLWLTVVPSSEESEDD